MSEVPSGLWTESCYVIHSLYFSCFTFCMEFLIPPLLPDGWYSKFAFTAHLHCFNQQYLKDKAFHQWKDHMKEDSWDYSKTVLDQCPGSKWHKTQGVFKSPSPLIFVKVSALKVFLGRNILKLTKVIWQEIKHRICSLNLLMRVTFFCWAMFSGW